MMDVNINDLLLLTQIETIYMYDHQNNKMDGIYYVHLSPNVNSAYDLIFKKIYNGEIREQYRTSIQQIQGIYMEGEIVIMRISQ